MIVARLCLEDDRGFAVIVAMMGLLMMSAIGMALTLSSSIETLIARNFRDGAGAAYAAEAVALHAIHELSEIADWTLVLDGSRRSMLFDGTATDVRTLNDGSTIDLGEILNLANCGMPAACSASDLIAADAARPWGLANPQWRRFASGPLAELLGVSSAFYVVLLVGDDPAETDLDPTTDGSDDGNPGAGVLVLRAEAFGPGGVHSAIGITVARAVGERSGAGAAVRIVSWRAVS